MCISIIHSFRAQFGRPSQEGMPYQNYQRQGHKDMQGYQGT